MAGGSAASITGSDEDVEQAARQADREGRFQTAVSMLTTRFIHLNAHDDGLLPCLCGRCLDANRTTVTVEGTDYLRTWTLAKGRVLFFWMPTSLQDDIVRVRRAVAANLHRRLRSRS